MKKTKAKVFLLSSLAIRSSSKLNRRFDMGKRSDEAKKKAFETQMGGFKAAARSILEGLEKNTKIVFTVKVDG